MRKLLAIFVLTLSGCGSTPPFSWIGSGPDLLCDGSTCSDCPASEATSSDSYEVFDGTLTEIPPAEIPLREIPMSDYPILEENVVLPPIPPEDLPDSLGSPTEAERIPLPEPDPAA